jgi:hypothetical protein
MAPLVRLDVWSDYVCPFCYLEEPVLTRIIDEFGNDVKVNWQAFELRPEPVLTLDPDGEYLGVWSASVYPMASERGMNLKLPPVQPRSRRAFELTEFARDKGRFDERHHALFKRSLRKAKTSAISVFCLGERMMSPGNLFRSRAMSQAEWAASVILITIAHIYWYRQEKSPNRTKPQPRRSPTLRTR